ncbi:indolepyruvate oxidoreductase subunit IorA (IOR)(Indolepyruvate ferredoxin oxidoreductase subunit alpha) [Treponema primitia ZAS-2]|uniref:Indolepyruvate oxidoreductase subunit IorA n=1 Tax=Treponema primitia (strain ATCC BAA-887 / DSM 12427 / ZAS-2) TaxID=545694 RepID=F5YJ48_TREPZ|nr:thiamine pyrophosphate-dependent enzyme [Treponema primitia]AEF83742.1 indolepyruvate oxidoreductase subunit IorA (IOR)(Indolepyruvate ferredoxin oxidoreductase subunit alpha) [Treponema primitia ZAS-2]
MKEQALLGDEAAALGAIHAGLSAAYGYPGTPSTEIMEYLIENAQGSALAPGAFLASWCVNEKTALEAALGVSFAGKRAMVTMKHVGLNVASDPFMNGALLGIKGGLVIAVADDPGMHSSQNEQDSRFYASFAMVPCLEPRNQQEAYTMTREAFDLSEKFQVPVLLRMTTRLSHARAQIKTEPERARNPLSKAGDKTQWMLLPAYARRNYISLIEKQRGLLEWSVVHPSNKLELEGRDLSLAVITSGLGGNYYEENLEDLVKSRGGKTPARLHIGAYPLPEASILRLCEKADRVIVIEEGQPVIEERLRGILTHSITVNGKLDGTVSRTGELDPDVVRLGLALPPRPGVLNSGTVSLPKLPGRPPQLCTGCPHGDSYETIKKVIQELDPAEGHPNTAINSDIGCYALGATPPYSVPESIVCMGASVGMARGAAEAGIKYAIGVIGDSTFLHSGIPPLIDAIIADTPMTLIILDNSIVAMTGCQQTMIGSDKFTPLILGLGIKSEHLVELEAKRQLLEENAVKLKKEIEYPGLSVVIFKRECLEAFRKRRKAETQGGSK